MLFEGEKVRLRAYHKDDVQKAWEYINDPEIKKYLIVGIPYPVTLKEEEKWVENQSAQKDTYSFAVETLTDKIYIGGCGINLLDWKNRHAMVGIFIGHKDYLGKGFGTDAMKVLLRFIFREMNIHKVQLEVFGYNNRAIKSYEKCGFVIEGTLRDHIFKNGCYFDVYRMSILESEFYKLYGN